MDAVFKGYINDLDNNGKEAIAAEVIERIEDFGKQADFALKVKKVELETLSNPVTSRFYLTIETNENEARIKDFEAAFTAAFETEEARRLSCSQ